MRVQFPLPRSDEEKLTEWARKLVTSLVRVFSDINPVVDTGVVVLWPSAAELPPEYIKVDGAEYKVTTFPALARRLNSETTPGNFKVPDTPTGTPTGFVYIIKT